MSRLRLLYYVEFCEDCTVITAIHIRFNTAVEIESLQMERNVFEYPLARNKSELALAYALGSVDVVDLRIDRLNKVNSCKDCFNSDLRIKPVSDHLK